MHCLYDNNNKKTRISYDSRFSSRVVQNLILDVWLMPHRVTFNKSHFSPTLAPETSGLAPSLDPSHKIAELHAEVGKIWISTKMKPFMRARRSRFEAIDATLMPHEPFKLTPSAFPRGPQCKANDNHKPIEERLTLTSFTLCNRLRAGTTWMIFGQ